jgi:hypothetical protein
LRNAEMYRKLYGGSSTGNKNTVSAAIRSEAHPSR